jgi:hypothetical protein
MRAGCVLVALGWVADSLNPAIGKTIAATGWRTPVGVGRYLFGLGFSQGAQTGVSVPPDRGHDLLRSTKSRCARSGWDGFFGEADAAFFVVLGAGVATEGFMGGAFSGAGVWNEIPALFLGELSDLVHALVQVDAGEFHAFGFGFLGVFESLNPDCLSHVWPPVTRTTVAGGARRHKLVRGTAVLARITGPQ